MPRDRAGARRWSPGRLSLRAKVLAITAFVVVLGAGPAWAYWTANVSKTDTTTFTIGHLDIAAAPAAVTISPGPLYPGATAATVFTVSNAGSIPLSFYAKGAASGALGGAMVVRFTNAQTVTGAFPTASCGGTQYAPSASSLPTTTAAPSPVVLASPAAARSALQPSTGPYAGAPSATTICVSMGLPTTAANTLQGQSSTVYLQVTGDQVGQP